MKRILIALALMTAPALAPSAFAQSAAPALRYGWAPKPVSAPFVAPNRPVWRLADLRKRHAGAARWSQVVVRDARGLTGTYIQSAPGDVSPKVMYSDTTIFFVVHAGQLRVTIDGVEPFIAAKGVLVQVPSVHFYRVETVGDEPALRFEVTQTMAPPILAEGETPAPIAGRVFQRVGYYTNPPPYGAMKPFVDLKAIAAMGVSPVVQDDFVSAQLVRETAVPRPPASDKGHFHVGTSGFWYVIEGQSDVLIEGVPFFTAQPGDIVYAPAGRWHRATPGGIGIGVRLAIHPAGSVLAALPPDAPAP